MEHERALDNLDGAIDARAETAGIGEKHFHVQIISNRHDAKRPRRRI
jgi:hypothetical protein